MAHWLQKASEHVLGCVLCSPGCFSLMRADALVRNTQAQVDSAISVYKSRPTDALTTVQWNQGEDRWLCTLVMKRGWRIEYVAVSESLTNAPTGMKEFFNQRRRWTPSTARLKFGLKMAKMTIKNIEILRVFGEFQLFEPVVGHLTG